MEKNTFVKVMEEVEMLERYQDSIDSVFCLNDWPISNMCCHIAKAIANELGDKSSENGEYGPMIFDFMYEYDFGKNYRDRYLTKIGDKEYKPENFRELYDMYMELKNEP